MAISKEQEFCSWFVSYINNNPWDISKKKRDSKDDLERERDFIDQQVRRFEYIQLTTKSTS